MVHRYLFDLGRIIKTVGLTHGSLEFWLLMATLSESRIHADDTDFSDFLSVVGFD